MKDALGNDIVLGQKYGYSAKDTVFIGIADRLTAQKVALKTTLRRHFRYGEEFQRTWSEIADEVFVQSWHLFPIKE